MLKYKIIEFLLGCSDRRSKVSDMYNYLLEDGEYGVNDIAECISWLYASKIITIAEGVDLFTGVLHLEQIGVEMLENYKSSLKNNKWASIRSWVAIIIALAALILQLFERIMPVPK